MLRTHSLSGSGAVLEPAEPSEVGRLLGRSDGLLWLDVQDPTRDDIALLGREFHLHPLALEDAYKRHQRPKIDHYPDFCFMVMYALDVAPNTAAESGLTVTTREISIFFGKDYLITVHTGPAPEIEQAVARWDEVTANIGAHPGALLYAVLDTVVDSYFPAADLLADALDAIEEKLFEQFDRRLSVRLFGLRRQLIAIRRFLAPEREILNTLLRHEGALLPHGIGIYLQDVHDHILRVTDTVDTYRDMLAGDLDAYLSTVSNSLNQVMKTLTAISAVLMTAALITGFYGMNVNYPARDTEAGYRWAVGLIALSSLGIIMIFRRLRWF